MIDSDSDSDSWLVATTPGDSDSGSDSNSAHLLLRKGSVEQDKGAGRGESAEQRRFQAISGGIDGLQLSEACPAFRGVVDVEQYRT